MSYEKGLIRTDRGLIIDKGNYAFDPRHPDLGNRGAKGDGSTNDARAINDALTEARKAGEYGTADGEGLPVLLPSGIYKIDSALDVTGAQQGLVGSGSHQTVIRGNTGGVAIDCTSLGSGILRDFLLDVLGMSSPSTVGILQARLPSSANADLNTIQGVTIRLGTDSTANNNNGTVGVYNCASENARYVGCNFRGDVGLYIGSGNGYNLTSPIKGSIDANDSMTVVELVGSCAIFGLAGPAVRINGGASIDLGVTSISSQASQVGVTKYDYAIEVVAQTTDLRYGGSMEEYNGLLKTTFDITGLYLDCYMAHDAAQHRIYLGQGASLIGGKIDIKPVNATFGGKLFEVEAGFGSTVQGVDITLYDQDLGLNGSSALKGCIIRSNRTLALTKASIAAGTITGCVLMCSDGVEFYGLGEIEAAGGYRQTIDGWHYENVAASLGAGTSVPRLDSTYAFSFDWIAPRAGSVTGIVVKSNEARTAGSLTVEVYKNSATALGITATLDATNTTTKATTQAKDLDTFVAGDRLSVAIMTDASWAPTTADIRVAIEVET